MEAQDNDVILAAVCIAFLACIATLVTRNPAGAALALLPLGLAVWMLYSSR